MSAIQKLNIRGENFVLIPAAEYQRLIHRPGPALPKMPAVSSDGIYPAASAMRTMMARKIIAARKAVGLTQSALARKAGIRVETLNRLEKGKHTPDLTTMAKINKALDKAGAGIMNWQFSHPSMIIVETDRLVLRHFQIVDGDAMDRVFGDPDVMKYGDGIHDKDWVRKWIRGCLEDYQKWGFGLYAVVEKNAGEVIGFCGLSWFPDVGGQPETEIGYRLARAYWGRGYGTEAALAVRDYGFNTLNLARMISIIDARNAASIRVAEKIGLRFEKDVIFQGFPDRVYAIHRTPADRKS